MAVPGAGAGRVSRIGNKSQRFRVGLASRNLLLHRKQFHRALGLQVTDWNSIILHHLKCCLFCCEPLGTAPRESCIQLCLYHNDLLLLSWWGQAPPKAWFAPALAICSAPSPWCWLLCGLLPVSPKLIPTGASPATMIVAASIGTSRPPCSEDLCLQWYLYLVASLILSRKVRE